MLGKDLLILNGSGTALIAAARSCEIEMDCKMIETASPTSSTAKTFIAGRSEWSITLSYLTSAPHTDLLKVGGSAVQVRVAVRDGGYASGSALFKTCRVSGTVGNLAQGSFVLQGTGPLSPAAQ